MATICEYNIIVKGKKSSCYAYFNSQIWMDYKNILEESGTNNNYSIRFSGNCKGGVNLNCTEYDGDYPIELPNDIDGAVKMSKELRAWDYTIKGKSKMFGVETMCNSRDAENEPTVANYEHYLNGEAKYSEPSKEISFEGTETINNLTAEEARCNSFFEEFENDGILNTSQGHKFAVKDNKLYLDDVFSIDLPRDTELKVITTKEDENVTEEYLEIADIMETNDEDVMPVKFQFSNGNVKSTIKKALTFADTSKYYVKVAEISGGKRSFLDGITGNMVINLIIKTKLKRKKAEFYIATSMYITSETAFATQFRLLENLLNGIVILKGNEHIKITRFSNGAVNNIYSNIFEKQISFMNLISNNSSDDDENDDEDE